MKVALISAIGLLFLAACKKDRSILVGTYECIYSQTLSYSAGGSFDESSGSKNIKVRRSGQNLLIYLGSEPWKVPVDQVRDGRTFYSGIYTDNKTLRFENDSIFCSVHYSSPGASTNTVYCGPKK